MLYSREKNCVESLLVMRERERVIALFAHTSEPSATEWEHPSSPRTLSASKVLDSVFWIHRTCCRRSSQNVDVHWMPSSEPRWKACHRPSGECPSLLSDGVILLHDNAWLHTAQQNSGPHSPHLAPIDIIYFPYWMISQHCFTNDEDINMLISRKVLSILDGRTYHMPWQVPQLSSGLC